MTRLQHEVLDGLLQRCIADRQRLEKELRALQEEVEGLREENVLVKTANLHLTKRLREETET